jgi:methyl-accepting chemotaxis protein
MFRKLTLQTRLYLLVLIAALGTLILAASALVEMRESMKADYSRTVRLLVESGFSTIEHLHGMERRGEISRDEAQTRAREALRQIRFGDGDYLYIWTLKGDGVMHPFRPDFEGQSMVGKIAYDEGRRDLLGDMVALLANQSDGYLLTEFPRPGSNQPVPKLQYLKKFAPWGWMVGSGIYLDDIDKAFARNATRLGVIGALIVVVLVAVAWVITRSVVRELGGEPREAVALMRKAAEGDLSVDVGNAPRDSLLGALGAMLGQLRTMMSKIGDSAQEVATSSTEIAAMTGNVAEAAARQSDASSAIAAAIEEMTVSINQISDNAGETRQSSSLAANLANTGEVKAVSAAEEIKLAAATVAEASERIAHLVESASQIGSIANVIKEIAAQTNLLALNAAIEAARAGEQGRGFAVVADEVRGLAERTASATVQIEQMIGTIQDDTSRAVEVMSQVSTRVRSGVGLVEEATASLKEIRSGVGVTLDHISDVADATREQSIASDAIAAQVEQIAQMVEDTSSSVREAAGALNQLENLSSQLHELVGRFRY